MVLGIILIGFLVVWGVADWVTWKNGGETFSRWISKQSEESKEFAWMIFLILVLSCVLLIGHFGLLENM